MFKLTTSKIPYKILSQGHKFAVENAQTGHLFSKGTTKTKAQKQMRLLEGIEHGTLIPKKKNKTLK